MVTRLTGNAKRSEQRSRLLLKLPKPGGGTLIGGNRLTLQKFGHYTGAAAGNASSHDILDRSAI